GIRAKLVTGVQTCALPISAFHMPRSVGLFRAWGWRVVPDPVGYRTGANSSDTKYNLDFEQNLALLTVALKEWFGMLANRVLGHKIGRASCRERGYIK